MSGQVEHIQGTTFHGRHGALENAFRYGVDYICIEPEAAQATPWLFSHNRGNLTSLSDKDHGGPPKAGDGVAWVRRLLAEQKVDVTGRVLLLAQPRVLGHVFNPVSFWLVYDVDKTLRVVIAEVTNTFGDRHSYLCHHPDLREITRRDQITARKIFHVSPFQPVAGGYQFRFDIRPDRVGIWIDYKTESGGGVLATLTGRRGPLTNRSILRACLRRPFGARRVLALIHWQALKLWWKGATYRARPLPPAKDVS